MAEAAELRRRVAAIDWESARGALDAIGHARVPGLLRASECRELIALYEEHERFRSTVEMAPRRYGEGQYRYFARPLPSAVEALRRALYPPLARIANGWQHRLGRIPELPARLADFEARCRAAGQQRPTPLLLRYRQGGFNCLHQDVYGRLAFPLQVAILLSQPERDFEGGEFLLVEQRPRQQSRGEAVRLRRGEALVFPNALRPVAGSRGNVGIRVRHGVSRVLRGERYTLGIIFHDAE